MQFFKLKKIHHDLQELKHVLKLCADLSIVSFQKKLFYSSHFSPFLVIQFVCF